MRKIIVAIVALLVTTSVSAQEFRWGPTGAINLSWLHGAKNASSDCYVGFHAGIKAERDFSSLITDGFYLEGKFVYTLKGASWSGVHNNLGYLELPINIGYRYPLSDNLSLMGGVGPYFGLGILGKTVTKIDGSKVKSDIFGQDLQRFDFGLNYNLGVELWNQWQFFVGFEHSLINVVKSQPDGAKGFKYRPLNLYFGTAFMF